MKIIRRRQRPTCIGRKLLAGEAAANGLNAVKVWYDCTLGRHWHCPNCNLHPKKKAVK